MRYCHHCVKQRHLCYYCRVNDACTVNYLTNTTEDLRLNIKRINCVDRTQDFCQKIAKTLPKHCQKIAKVEKHHLNPWTIIQCHHWINSRSKLSKFELNAEAEELWRWAEMTTDKGVKADTAGHGRVIWWHTLLPPLRQAAMPLLLLQGKRSLCRELQDLRLDIKRIKCVDRTQDFCQKIAKTLAKHCQKIAKVEKLNPWNVTQCDHWINLRSKLRLNWMQKQKDIITTCSKFKVFTHR